MGSHPEPEQRALLVRLLIILVSTAGVDRVVIVEQLDVCVGGQQ
jgi:hypothetical protein